MHTTWNPILNRLDDAEQKLKSNTSDMQALENRVTEIERFIEQVGTILSGEAKGADPEGLQTRIDKAIRIIMSDGCHNGGHHKQYALDQALRILAGERYEEIVREWESGEDGPRTYEWDTGIPCMSCGDKTSDSPHVSDGHLCWGCGYDMKGCPIEYDEHSGFWLFVNPCPECGLNQPDE